MSENITNLIDQSIVTDKQWEDIHCLSPEVFNKIKQEFKAPSHIQFLSIGESIEFIQPVLTVKCRNGGGKTLCFCIPAVEFAYRNKTKKTQKISKQANVSKGNSSESSVYCPTSIIIVSTQPLADQTFLVLSQILPNGVSAELLYSDKKVTFSGQILVATPKLLWKYLINLKVIQLDNLQHLAIDEADSVIKDFTVEIRDIMNKLRGRDVVTQLISATLSEKNMEMIKGIFSAQEEMEDQEMVYSIELPWKLKGVTQYYQKTDNSVQEKFKQCKKLIDNVIIYNQQQQNQKKDSQIIIFFEKLSTIESVEALIKEQCTNWKFTSCGNKSERNENIRKFRNGNFDIMLASRVMSRGIDIRKVGLVINFDLPKIFDDKSFDGTTYLHNIGRTGRFDDKGVSLTFISSDQVDFIISEIKRQHDSTIEEYSQEILLHKLDEVMENNSKEGNLFN